MNAPLAATLLCLCNLADAMPSAQTPFAPHAAATATTRPSVAAPTPSPDGAPDTARSGTRAQTAATRRPIPEGERGLLLAGFTLMAGIALRRLVDAAP